LSRLSDIIAQFEKENTHLSNFLSHLENAAHSPTDRQLLFQDFESEFARQLVLLDNRHKKLESLEDFLNSFRGYDPPTVAVRYRPKPVKRPMRFTSGALDRSKAPGQSLMVIPLSPPTPRATDSGSGGVGGPKAPTGVLQTLARVIDASKPRQESFDSVRVTLLKENDRLREVALHQERLYLIQKLRLRLYHDHRDLAALRRFLRGWKAGEKEFSNGNDLEQQQEVEKTKMRVANLKTQISRERWRLRVISELTREDKAAIVIQSLCRGFLQRSRAARQKAE
jgi:hypothetical protein